MAGKATPQQLNMFLLRFRIEARQAIARYEQQRPERQALDARLAEAIKANRT